ncbi:hypothetical protein [Thalassoroseus pseudoceratinae]|uniref:hypothetical protein n=1 Tax=Thalassoroseus pseudoceratinae TaxID=2713176 RepID=UPI001420DC1E|nr:hypothetical protein [Thalassoroseus pseudoceratinae]
MSRLIFALMISMLTIFTLGCPSQNDGELSLDQKLEAAKKISDPTARNESLKEVSLAAAAAADDGVVIDALNEIQDVELRNATAETAAKVLADKDDGDAALEVAELITDEDQKNEVLKSLAESNPIPETE